MKQMDFFGSWQPAVQVLFVQWENLYLEHSQQGSVGFAKTSQAAF